jgi:methyltransferase (TIGR00027 family)
MAEPKHQVDLGAIQQTLFIPLAARARETAKKRPLVRDPRAVELVESIDFDTAKYGRGAGGMITVLRTAIFDQWVSAFLAEHPAGTVVELGTGLNTRFERVDNGRVRWFDLDLPDTIELRRKFFTDTDRRRMIAASVLDTDWLDTIMSSPGPYFFVSEGVLVYLPEDDVTAAIARIAQRFPGSHVALDTYSTKTLERQHRLAAKRNMAAPWQWPCDDPRVLERLGLRLLETVPFTRPPKPLRDRLPFGQRHILPLVAPALGGLALSLFRAVDSSSAGTDQR